LEPPKPKRAIPRGLASHRSELERQTAQAEALRASLARMTFADVQAYHVQDFLDAIRKASRMPATLQLERAVLRGLFNYAAKVWRWSEPAGNPAVGLSVEFHAILTRSFHPILTHPYSSPEGSRCG